MPLSGGMPRPELMIRKPRKSTASISGSGSAPVLPVAESPRELATMVAKSGTRLRDGKEAGASKSADEAAIVDRRYNEPVRDNGTSVGIEGSSMSSSSSSSGFVMLARSSSGLSLRSRASAYSVSRCNPFVMCNTDKDLADHCISFM